MSSKTKYFQNCLGVFQGGGCKGAAYVGAFKQCMERGVSFSEVVGASAGAIVAVFIAAGASPSQLEDIIRKMDFKRFLRAANDNPSDSSLPWYVNKSKWIIPEKYKSYHTIVSKLGIYESSYIEEFVNEHLKLLLKTNKRVSFKDLIIPCSVVVSDLQTNNVKVYSSDETPEDDVASAVRKSANIPIFFQPIENRYVDGGMLSNLPVFLYKGKDNLYNKVLAFTLNSEEENEPINNIEQYVGALINTSLFGNTSIQIELANGVNPLNINTGDIKTTDFDKINDETISYLINQGFNSAKEFFDNEINLLKEYAYRPDISKNGNDSNNRITDTINDNISDIIFVGTSTKFVYDLFPTVYNWTNNGSKIKVLLKENNDDETHGPYRERLLKQLGAEIIKEKTIPFSGILINSHIDGVGKAIIYNQSEKENPNYHSKFYHGKEDSDIINILRESVNSKFADSSNKVKVTFEQIRSEELIQKIKDVPQYVGKDVKISLEEVKLEDLTFLTKFVNGFKFRQIQNIIDIYEKHEIELFKPMRMIFPDGKSTMITPPVIEKDGDLSLIIEGNTRITSLFRRGVKKCFIIVVQGVSTPVPSEGRFKCNEILITDNERKGIKRYKKFDHDYFRYIEFAVRNPDTCLL